MEHLPPDIFTLLGENLSLEDIIHLAFSNSKIKSILMSSEVNRQLATSLGFPYNLTFDELVKYNNMYLGDRLVNAASTGDMRIVKALIYNDNITLYDYNQAAVAATLKDNHNILNLLLKLGANNYDEIALASIEIGDRDLLVEMLSKNGWNNTPPLYRSIGKKLGYFGCSLEYYGDITQSSIQRDYYYSGYIYGAIEGNHFVLLRKLLDVRKKLRLSYLLELLDNAIVLEKTEIANYLFGIVEGMLYKGLYNQEGAADIGIRVNRIFVNAARQGYLNIVTRLISLGADDYRNAFYAAKEGGHIEVAQEIKKWTSMPELEL